MIAEKFDQNVTIMHPLPKDSSAGVIDLSSDLDEYENPAIFRQTDNGMLVRMAVFTMVLDVDQNRENSFKAVKEHSYLHNASKSSE